MTTNAELTAALDSFKPELAARYDRMVRHQFERLVHRHSANLKNVANTTDYRVWANTVRPMCVSTKTGNTLWDFAYSIDDARLAAEAAKYADEVVEQWGNKIEAKLGELDGARVLRMDGCRFLIVGTRAGVAVEIQQDMILNVSSKGTLFNQWPSRIYVNKKFLSEAAYRKRFAA